MGDVNWSKFASRKFIVAVGTLVSAVFGVQLPTELLATLAGYLAAQGAVDFQAERRRPEVERIRRDQGQGGES